MGSAVDSHPPGASRPWSGLEMLTNSQQTVLRPCKLFSRSGQIFLAIAAPVRFPAPLTGRPSERRSEPRAPLVGLALPWANIRCSFGASEDPLDRILPPDNQRDDRSQVGTETLSRNCKSALLVTAVQVVAIKFLLSAAPIGSNCSQTGLQAAFCASHALRGTDYGGMTAFPASHEPAWGRSIVVR